MDNDYASPSLHMYYDDYFMTQNQGSTINSNPSNLEDKSIESIERLAQESLKINLETDSLNNQSKRLMLEYIQKAFQETLTVDSGCKTLEYLNLLKNKAYLKTSYMAKHLLDKIMEVIYSADLENLISYVHLVRQIGICQEIDVYSLEENIHSHIKIKLMNVFLGEQPENIVMNFYHANRISHRGVDLVAPVKHLCFLAQKWLHSSDCNRETIDKLKEWVQYFEATDYKGTQTTVQSSVTVKKKPIYVQDNADFKVEVKRGTLRINEKSISIVVKSTASSNPAKIANMNIECECYRRIQSDIRFITCYNWRAITEAEYRVKLVLEYCSNTLEKDLRERMRSKRAYSEKYLKKLFLDLISAFEFLKYRGIFHLDIKPSNFFIDTDANIKIGDFNSAVLDSPTTSDIRGTNGYMSPEMQMKYIRSLTFRQNDDIQIDCEKNDVFSLGLMFLSMLILEPSASKNSQEHLLGLRELIGKVPFEWAYELLGRMLEFDPNSRYSFSMLIPLVSSETLSIIQS